MALRAEWALCSIYGGLYMLIINWKVVMYGKKLTQSDE